MGNTLIFSYERICAFFGTQVGTRDALPILSEQPGQGIPLEVLGDASNMGIMTGLFVL